MSLADSATFCFPHPLKIVGKGRYLVAAEEGRGCAIKVLLFLFFVRAKQRALYLVGSLYY